MPRKILHTTTLSVMMALSACSNTGGADIPLIPVPESGKF